jgi:predicted  nucleic acid-binding Zn-ribbon protein
MRRCDLSIGNVSGGELGRIQQNTVELQHRRAELERQIDRVDEGLETARRLLRAEQRRLRELETGASARR